MQRQDSKKLKDVYQRNITPAFRLNLVLVVSDFVLRPASPAVVKSRETQKTYRARGVTSSLCCPRGTPQAKIG